MKTNFKNQCRPHRRAFTLIELLVVISIIAVLTALLIPTLAGVFKAKKISTVKGEMEFIKSALEQYKAKYGVYPPCNSSNVLANQLYYELNGVTNTTGTASVTYQTLDGIYQLSGYGFGQTFFTGGIINCSRGSGEDVVTARNFLMGLKPNQISTGTNNYSGGNLIPYLVTSVGGPDPDYHPASFTGNPFRYLYPGVHNPNSYDLWIKLSINQDKSVSKYLICNWNSQVQVDTSGSSGSLP